MNRRGFTLIEILMITALVMVILTQMWNLFSRGSDIMNKSTQSLSLQTGIRALMENMVHDVNASIAFLNTSNQKMILARYKGPVDDDMFLLNDVTSNPVFPYYLEGQQTKVNIPALFVEYEYFPESTTVAKPQTVKRVAKEGVLECTDSPENSPYVIDTYAVNTAALTELGRRQLAEKVSYLNMDYYGYEDSSGQLKSIGELGSSDMVAAKAAMVAVHVIAEHPDPRPNQRTPKMELYTKIWSYRMIHDNKYPEYFGHTDRDLRF